MKTTEHQGRIWVLLDRNGRLIEDVDTDQIYHNAFLHITEISQMGVYALGNLEGWKDFPSKAKPGEVIVAGRNFGAGSSRQQAVDCFIALGIAAIVAPSYASIYFRNAVNSGFPVVKAPGLEDLAVSGKWESGDELRLDFTTGKIVNLTKNAAFQAEPMSAVQMDIFRAGSLFAYGKTVVR